MTERIYSEKELLEEKPKGALLMKNEDGKTFRLFACHGCQTCFYIYEDDSGEEKLGVNYPHFLSFEEIM